MNLPFIRLACEWVGFAAILAGTHCCAEDVMPPARSNVVALLSSGVIPAAGAEAYREYALHSVLACAHAAAVKWGLETNLIAAGKVTSLEAKPFPDGSSDITVVFGDRYFFAAFSHEGRFLFRDLVYELKWALSATTYKQHTYAVELTRHGTNHLSLEKAQRIAATAVRSVGLAAAESAVANPSRAEQLTWRNGSTNYSLPCYGFQWESGLDGGCTVAVSGIISNVVMFDSESPRLRLPSPTNLVELLGLPAGTIFVKSRQLAYKWVEAQAMLAEVNFCAERLTLPMRLARQ